MKIRLPETLKGTFFLYLAQIVNLFLGWVVAKLNIAHLNVAEYGQLSFFISLINFTFVFFTLGIFESASRLIALTDSRREYRRLVAATLLLTGGVYFLFTLFFGAGSYWIDSLFQVKIAFLVRQLFPLAGVFLFLIMWQMILRGAGKIVRLSWYMFLPRVAYALFLGMLVWGGWFTLTRSALGNLLSIGAFALGLFFLERPDFRDIRKTVGRLVKEVRSFGIHVYFGEIIKVFLYHVDKLFISFFLDAEQLAFYALAYTVSFPLTFFSTALSTSLYKKFSQQNKIRSEVLWLNLSWIVLSVIALILLRKWIILDLFSPRYARSLTVIPLLAIAFGLAGISRLFSYFLTARGQGKAIRNISVVLLVTHLSACLILIPHLGILGAALAILLTYLVDLLLSVYYYRRFRLEMGNR